MEERHYIPKNVSNTSPNYLVGSRKDISKKSYLLVEVLDHHGDNNTLTLRKQI